MSHAACCASGDETAMFFCQVMTPSLTPTGPDDRQFLDTSSVSVVIVIVNGHCDETRGDEKR